jgi:hypothetical protein
MIDSNDRLSGLLKKAKLLDMKRHMLKSGSKLSNEEKEKIMKEIHELVMELES